MNQYELLYIVSNQYTDAEIEKISEQISGVVTQAGAVVISRKNIGKIRLAYPIKKQQHGTYVLVYFDAKPGSIEVLERKLALTDEVLRHTITTRREGAENEQYELTSYVAPLSEEARRERQKDKEEAVKPTYRRIVDELAPPTPSSSSTKEHTMSMEELDKKLDELLDVDVTKNI